MLHHIEGNGTVCKKEFSRLGVDARRIGLESAHSCQHLCNHHRKHSGHIALATGYDAFGIKTSQSHASRIANSGQQVEATQRKSLQLMPFDNRLQCQIYLMGTGQCLANGKFLGDIGIGCRYLHRGSRNRVERRGGYCIKQFLHRNVYQFNTQKFANLIFVGMTGNQPIGRLSRPWWRS